MIFKKHYNLEKVYEEVAKRHGVTVEEVKRDMTEAMKLSDTDIDNLDEFILTATAMVKKEMEQKNKSTN